MMQEGHPETFVATDHYTEKEIRTIEEARQAVAGLRPGSYAEARRVAGDMLRALGVAAEVPEPTFRAGTEEGAAHYRDIRPPEAIMDTMEAVAGRFRDFGTGDLRSFRDMERYGRQLLEYSVELEEAWKVRRIGEAKRDIVSRVPEITREADDMERKAETDIGALGMELRPEGERWDLEREYYSEIPGILADISEREEKARTALERMEGDEHRSPEEIALRKAGAEHDLEEIPGIREEYGRLRLAKKTRLEELGIRTDLSAEEAERLGRARRVLSGSVPDRRAEAAGIAKGAGETLETYGTDIPDPAGGNPDREGG